MTALVTPITSADPFAALRRPTPVTEITAARPASVPSPVSVASGLTMPENVMYGLLGDHARTLGVPLAWAYTSLLTHYAGMGPNLHDYSCRVRPTLYTYLIAPPEMGKSTAMTRAQDSLLGPKHYIKITTPGSDRGLQQMFKTEKPEKKKGVSVVPEPEMQSWLLRMNEARNLMSKIKVPGSGESLAATLCDLWDQDEAGSADKTGDHTIKARISILTALAVKDREEFGEIFGSATGAGLYSRCIFAPHTERWELDPEWEPRREFIWPQSDPDKYTTMPAECYAALKAWRRVGEALGRNRNRLGEIAMRVALLASSASGELTVSLPSMEAALRFSEWQERVRMHYSATDAQNDSASITEMILSAYSSHRDADGNPKWGRFRDFVLHKNWARKWGSSNVTREREALVSAGLLEAEVHTPPAKQQIDASEWRPKHTGMYRLAVGS